MKQLYIVDFSNWVYKFKYVYDLSHTLPSGERINTSVLYGFYSALKSHRYNDIIIALDGCPLRSQSYLPQYKQQRIHSNSNQIFVPKKELLQFLTQLGPLVGKNIRVVGSYGQEADQVIASLVYMAKGLPTLASLTPELQRVSADPYIGRYVEELVQLDLSSDYDTVIIGSTDSDIYSLTSIFGVYMDQSWNGTKVDWERTTPKAVSNMPPHLIAIYKSFCGDVSDNIPAVVASSQLKKVRESLISWNPSRADFLDFCTKLRIGASLDSSLRYLANCVTEGRGVRELRRNFAVVELCFESIPQQLSFPTYSIQDTFERYALNQ